MSFLRSSLLSRSVLTRMGKRLPDYISLAKVDTGPPKASQSDPGCLLVFPVLLLRSLLGAYFRAWLSLSIPHHRHCPIPPHTTRHQRIEIGSQGVAMGLLHPIQPHRASQQPLLAPKITAACTPCTSAPSPSPPRPHPRSTPRIDTTATEIGVVDWVLRDGEGRGWSGMGGGRRTELNCHRWAILPPPRHSLHPNSSQTTPHSALHMKRLAGLVIVCRHPPSPNIGCTVEGKEEPSVVLEDGVRCGAGGSERRCRTAEGFWVGDPEVHA
jgi:hypothetical protein